MKNNLLLLLALFWCGFTTLFAQDTIKIKEPQTPILIERHDNVLYYIRVEQKENHSLGNIDLELDKEVNLNQIQSIKVYYAGTEARQRIKNNSFAPQPYLSKDEPNKTLSANASYSILKTKQTRLSHYMTLAVNQTLFSGVNYFWVSIEMNPKSSLHSLIKAKINKITLDGKEAILLSENAPSVHRLGIGVRHAGNDGVSAFRIPGLVTTNKGTLLGVYDARYNNSVDLQEYVNVGLSRSTNGGKTWEKMRLPLAFGEYGGLPKAQNGVGDPAILVDKKSGTIWIMAAWTHGMGNDRAWWNSHTGNGLNETAQLMITKSTDDGVTWSKPINITSQVKDPSWFFLLQGPGRGITMNDGTLVFAAQYIDSTRTPNAAIVYSKDQGKNWSISKLARTNTTEAQVVELESGTLMLNMRDNRGGSRAVAITKDMGESWTEHPSSRSALRESVCMASLIKVPAKENILNKDILLFSNPNTTKGRHHITIKASLDNGITWNESNQLLLDEEENWGYSCMTMIDKETVGILYESSAAHMTFQSIKLTDIIKN